MTAYDDSSDYSGADPSWREVWFGLLIVAILAGGAVLIAIAHS